MLSDGRRRRRSGRQQQALRSVHLLGRPIIASRSSSAIEPSDEVAPLGDLPLVVDLEQDRPGQAQ